MGSWSQNARHLGHHGLDIGHKHQSVDTHGGVHACGWQPGRSDIADLKACLPGQPLSASTLGRVGNPDRRHIDADDVCAGLTGNPQGGAAAPASEIDDGVTWTGSDGQGQAMEIRERQVAKSLSQ
jgi:hypothetical protein